MTLKLFVTALATILLLAQPPASLAQDAARQQDWAAAQSIAPGSQLLVETKTGERIKATLSSVSDTSLTLIRSNQTINLSRADIQRAYRLRRRSRVDSTLVGAGYGGAVGLAVGIGSTVGFEEYRREGGFLLVGTALGAVGAGIGAAVGAVIGSRPQRTLIYEAP